ncbi:MAG: CsgG/HfaB family protein [Verrucomicrobiota bacterium]|jgi:TolB-like protein
MNRRTIPTLLLFAALAMMARAADAPKSPLTVAVYDFTGEAGAASYGKMVTTLVTVDLATQTNLALVERVELSKSLREQAFGVSGMVSSDAAAQIGHITGAKVLVAGQVMKTGDNHLVIVANIIGTETGRLFAEKVEGGADNIMDLTDKLSGKIARTISDQTTNLVAPAQETSAQRLARIIKSIPGANRPSVSVNILLPAGTGHSAAAEAEFGIVLLKAGFQVVDEKSDRKPDLEMTGVDDISAAPKQGGLFACRAVIELKVQERRTGNIVLFDRQESTATDTALSGADRAAQINAVDALAERVLPLLAK